MLTILSISFLSVAFGGVVTDETTMGFLFSDTVTSGRTCGWALADTIQNIEDKDGDINGGKYTIPFPPYDGVSGKLPFNILALHEDFSQADTECHKDDFKDKAWRDEALYYDCKTNNNLRARRYKDVNYNDCGDVNDWTSQDQWEASENPNGNTHWNCNGADTKCTAEVEFEVYDDVGCNSGDVRRTLRYQVPVDTCVPYKNKYYEFRCGPKEVGSGYCDADDIGLNGGDGCSKSIAFYEFTNSVCSGSGTFKAGYVTDTSSQCTDDCAADRSYTVEVDCPH